MSFLLQVLENSRKRLRALQIQRREDARSKGRIERYNFDEHERKKVAPLFGVDPSEAYFSLDWAFRKAPQAAPQGVYRPGVPLPIKTNRGSTINLKSVKTSRPHIDPALGWQDQTSYRKTDQRVSPRGSVVNWDGQIRVHNKPKSFELIRRQREKTPADKHTAELKKFPFDFST